MAKSKRTPKVKRSIGSKAAKSGTMLRASSGAPSPWTCRLCKRPGGDLIPFANSNHFMIVDELSAALASRLGYGSGEAGAPRHSRSRPAGLYGTHLSAIPIAVMKRGRSSCFRSRT